MRYGGKNPDSILQHPPGTTTLIGIRRHTEVPKRWCFLFYIGIIRTWGTPRRIKKLYQTSMLKLFLRKLYNNMAWRDKL